MLGAYFLIRNYYPPTRHFEVHRVSLSYQLAAFIELPVDQHSCVPGRLCGEG